MNKLIFPENSFVNLNGELMVVSKACMLELNLKRGQSIDVTTMRQILQYHLAEVRTMKLLKQYEGNQK